MKMTSRAALVAALSTFVAAPALAQGSLVIQVRGGETSYTNNVGNEVDGTFVGIGGGYVHEFDTTGGFTLDAGLVGSIDVVDAEGTWLQYECASASCGGPYQYHQGLEIDGRARVAIEVGLRFGDVRLSAARGFAVAHVGELWMDTYSNIPGQNSNGADRSFAGGDTTEYGVSMAFGDLLVGLTYAKSDLVLREYEFSGTTYKHGLEEESLILSLTKKI
jgi:hypothetical protein